MVVHSSTLEDGGGRRWGWVGIVGQLPIRADPDCSSAGVGGRSKRLDSIGGATAGLQTAAAVPSAGCCDASVVQNCVVIYYPCVSATWCRLRSGTRATAWECTGSVVRLPSLGRSKACSRSSIQQQQQAQTRAAAVSGTAPAAVSRPASSAAASPAAAVKRPLGWAGRGWVGRGTELLLL